MQNDYIDPTLFKIKKFKLNVYFILLKTSQWPVPTARDNSSISRIVYPELLFIHSQTDQ